MTKVTVIIPVYNAEKTIARAVASIPDRGDIEIIIVDDGSTDGTVESIGNIEWGSHYEPRLIYCDKNYGVAHAVNQGLDKATGEYVVLLGADDWFYVDKFEEAMNYLDGKTDLVYFNLEITSGKIWRTTEDTKKDLCGSVKFMRREFIGDTRNKESLKFAEDKNFYERLLEKQPSEVFTDLTVKHYVWPQENSLSGRHMRGEI